MKNSTLIIHPEELSGRWIDRLADAGVEILGIHPHGGSNAKDSLASLVALMRTDEYRAQIDYAISRGIEIEYEIHAGGYLLPREMFSEHPEYFRMNESGERVKELNFCFSNENALKIVADNAKKLAKRLYRSSDNFHFWLDDSKDMGCKCPKCSQTSISDHQLNVMNTILAALREDRPNARLCYLAYYETMALPTSIKASDGIFLEYAPIERDLNVPLSNAEQSSLDELRSLVEFFGKKNAKVLEYWYDNSLFSKWKKPPIKFVAKNDVVRADVEFYSSLGFENISSFACFLGDDYTELFGEPDLSGFKKENFIL